jgi:hypothetical protein
MEALIKYWGDKFTPEELIEHIGISMQDLLYILEESGWARCNIDDFKADFEQIYQVGETYES